MLNIRHCVSLDLEVNLLVQVFDIFWDPVILMNIILNLGENGERPCLVVELIPCYK